MKNILIVIVAFIAVFLIVIGNWEFPSGRYYNCRDVDFHPDVPPQVRVECRKMIKDHSCPLLNASDPKCSHETNPCYAALPQRYSEPCGKSDMMQIHKICIRLGAAEIVGSLDAEI